MSVIVSSFMPFPPLNWWRAALTADTVILDKAEHFEKMSYRNKYHITGSNGMITLSLPLERGREQRTAMREVRICNTDKWQVQHWRTLVSVYKRAPFFEHYEPSLQRLFEQRFDLLTDFNRASIEWVMKQLKAGFSLGFAEEYLKQYSNATDLRNMKRSKEQNADVLKYYQLFEERNGFLPNLSVLDLLFSEGPHTAEILSGSV